MLGLFVLFLGGVFVRSVLVGCVCCSVYGCPSYSFHGAALGVWLLYCVLSCCLVVYVLLFIRWLFYSWSLVRGCCLLLFMCGCLCLVVDRVLLHRVALFICCLFVVVLLLVLLVGAYLLLERLGTCWSCCLCVVVSLVVVVVYVLLLIVCVVWLVFIRGWLCVLLVVLLLWLLIYCWLVLVCLFVVVVLFVAVYSISLLVVVAYLLLVGVYSLLVVYLLLLFMSGCIVWRVLSVVVVVLSIRSISIHFYLWLCVWLLVLSLSVLLLVWCCVSCCLFVGWLFIRCCCLIAYSWLVVVAYLLFIVAIYLFYSWLPIRGCCLFRAIRWCCVVGVYLLLFIYGWMLVVYSLLCVLCCLSMVGCLLLSVLFVIIRSISWLDGVFLFSLIFQTVRTWNLNSPATMTHRFPPIFPASSCYWLLFLPFMPLFRLLLPLKILYFSRVDDEAGGCFKDKKGWGGGLKTRTVPLSTC